jgi:DNA-binding MarR family transcriptional regulator
MAFDALVANPGRLRILTALAGDGSARQPFVQLRRRTGLTDGNLATHARRLHSAGFIAIEKSIASGKPLTTMHLTPRGRDALTEHARSLLAALETPSKPLASPDNTAPGFSHGTGPADQADDWVD